MPISSETLRELTAESARSIRRPVSVNTFCDLSVRSMELRYMCWARARNGSLPQACRVRSHWSACTPLILCVPAVSFSPEPPRWAAVGRSQTFCFTQTSTPPTASAIFTTPAKSIVIQWSM